MLEPKDITNFWLDQVGPQGWYKVDAALDARIRDQFEGAWDAALVGGYDDWKLRVEKMLPFLILLDQFPRNMFRDQAKAFASDKIALCTAKKAIDRKWDMLVAEPARQFFYLPLMHSECLVDQDRCVRLVKSRMPELCADVLPHAKAHREVIRKFGRFPYRNAALGRRDTDLEKIFLADGGYSSLFKPA